MNDVDSPANRRVVEDGGVAVEYAEYRPCNALISHLVCYYTVTSFDRAPPWRKGRILPDGCTDLLFDLTDRGQNGGGVAIGYRRSFCIVPSQEPIRLFGVLLRPGAMRSLLNESMSVLSNQTVPLAAFWGRDASALHERLACESESEGMIRTIEPFLCRRFSGETRRNDLVRHTIQLIARSPDCVSLDEIARLVGRSTRQLRRLFNDSVGAGPKSFSRMARFLRTLERMKDWPGQSPADLALETGHYDQAHFIREVQHFSGLTPRQLSGQIRDADPECPFYAIPTCRDLLQVCP